MNLKRRKKKSLAQQSKQILILMTVILVIILGGCTYVLNKTSGQIYEQMSQMAQLYAQELDQSFFEDQPESFFLRSWIPMRQIPRSGEM